MGGWAPGLWPWALASQNGLKCLYFYGKFSFFSLAEKGPASVLVGL